MIAGVCHAEEWEKLLELPPFEATLDRGAPDVTYNEGNYKFERRTPIEFGSNQAVVMNVISYDYQPDILVRGAEGAIIARAELQKPQQDSEGRTFYSCALDFVPPDEGKYLLVHTSTDLPGADRRLDTGITQGKFEVSTVVFHVPEPEPEPDADAEDAPATDDTPFEVAPITELPMSVAGYKAERKPEIKQSGSSHRINADYKGKGTFIEMYGRYIAPGDQDTALAENYQPPDREKLARRQGNVFYFKENPAGFHKVFVISPTHEIALTFLLHKDHLDAMPEFVKVAAGLVKGLEARAVKRAEPLGTFGQ
jgi:hypothetical protein